MAKKVTAKKTAANIGFEKQIWDAACVLWGHIPAAEYRKVIVGLIFLRYISSAFDKRYQELVAEGDGFENDRDAYKMDNIFFVPEEARWSTIASAAHSPEIGVVLDNAMRAIEKENDSLKNVLPKNYANLSKSLRMIGTSFPINNCCSWENYNEFITIVEELQQFIVETEVDPEASLLHAHSFLWTYRYDDVQKGLVEPKYNSPKSAESLAEDAADLALNRLANSSKLKPQSVVIAPQKPAGSMISNGREVCRRSTQRAINAMGRANYQCEINPEHESFVRRSNKKPYVEAHHLIPLAYWRDFEYSIDVEANIVALCSTCHNRIHLGEDSKDLVKTLYEKRKEELEQSGIGIDLDSLLNMY